MSEKAGPPLLAVVVKKAEDLYKTDTIITIPMDKVVGLWPTSLTDLDQGRTMEIEMCSISGPPNKKVLMLKLREGARA